MRYMDSRMCRVY